MVLLRFFVVSTHLEIERNCIMYIENKGTEVSKNSPCPVCNHEDWCYIYPDGNVCCGRVDIAPVGWTLISKSKKDDRNIFALTKEYKPNQENSVKTPQEKTKPKRKYKPVPLPESITLCTGNLPKSEKKLHQDSKLGECYLTIYDYSENDKVYRYESLDGQPLPGTKSHKKCLPYSNGKFEKPDTFPPAYRIKEAIKLLEDGVGNALIIGEGEKVVDCLWSDLNLGSFTFQGSAWSEDVIKQALLETLEFFPVLVNFQDNDKEGERKAEKINKICNELAIPYLVINAVELWADCPDKGDIVDVVLALGKEETSKRINELILFKINPEKYEQQQKVKQLSLLLCKGFEVDLTAWLMLSFSTLNVEVESLDFEEIPPADIIAELIAEDYRDSLRFNNETGNWMRYQADYPGVWSAESDEFVQHIIYQIIRSYGITGYNANSYITNILKALQHQLIDRFWMEADNTKYQPFRNGVLDLQTKELLPHSPGYRLTWTLPREHDPNAENWDCIDQFLNHLTANNKQLKKVLIAYCNAVLKGRADLQKFLHLIGLGGTGKGTMARLITALIGRENVLTTTMEDWCSNRFEGANAYNKRLVLFPDEDKQTGKLGKFLSLTGEDDIRAEEKGKKAFSYRFKGMVLVCSNLPIFIGDAASRVKRRTITIPCNNQVLPTKRRNLEKEFEPELPAFTNYLLSIPDDEVKAVLLDIESVPEVSLEFWVNRIRVDSIAAWLNDHVISDPLSCTAIGCNRNEFESGSITTLFGSYSFHCKQTGDSPKSHKNFSPDLVELCNSVLGWKVTKEATKTGKYIKGIRLRQSGKDDHIPTHEYLLEQAVNNAQREKDDFDSVTVGDGRGDGSGDGSGFSHSTGFGHGDGSNPKSEKNNASHKSTSDFEELKNSPKLSTDFEFEPSPCPKSSQGMGSEPSPLPSPLPSPVKIVADDGYAGGFGVGDTVSHKNYPDHGVGVLQAYKGDGRWLCQFSVDGVPSPCEVSVRGMQRIVGQKPQDEPSLFDAEAKLQEAIEGASAYIRDAEAMFEELCVPDDDEDAMNHWDDISKIIQDIAYQIGQDTRFWQALQAKFPHRESMIEAWWDIPF